MFSSEGTSDALQALQAHCANAAKALGLRTFATFRPHVSYASCLDKLQLPPPSGESKDGLFWAEQGSADDSEGELGGDDGSDGALGEDGEDSEHDGAFSVTRFFVKVGQRVTEFPLH